MKPYLGLIMATWLLAVALAKSTTDAFGDTQMSLGLRYFYGDGVQQDVRKAEELFDGLDAKDQELLALMFKAGAPPVDRGNKRHAPDLAAAAKWHQRAAERGIYKPRQSCVLYSTTVKGFHKISLLRLIGVKKQRKKATMEAN